jgi:SAM-dependent methyltransferase
MPRCVNKNEGMAFIRDQQFEGDPLETRESDHYAKEYAKSLAEKWDELIDWERRAEGEGDFFIRALKERGKKRVLDVSTGTGFHSVRLLKEGFDVVSVDGSPEMLIRAFENGRRHGLILRTIHADWRRLNRDVHEKFDAVICLGNSFTHLFKERDRRKALAEFYAMLVHDGVLILDQRNYDHMLDHGFRCKHKYYYCGEDILAEPEYLDEGLARFRYTFPDGETYYLNMCPIRRNYMRRLMLEVGFQKVHTLGDFEETYRREEPDYFIHVAEKSYE